MGAVIDKETVKKLAQLCRIECTEEEQEKLLEDLQKILHYIDQLDEIETTNVAPLNHVLEDFYNITREDIIASPLLEREVFLNNAPSHVAGMVRVPQVIKQSS
jgi:aspartyl-tRNA(Asn)/glutamyl-tRNA(Gln) amidotransferase subunit C